jgi:ABC-type ATPase involved in cell division/GNAT superfamily N-acetyltransferase
VRVEVHNRCTDFNSYRAARVKSLFNAESGANFDLTADLPIDDGDWKIGVVVGPSGSGKTSIGRRLFGDEAFYEPAGWRDDAPIVDCIAPGGDFNEVTGALAAVGLGTVPTWLRPYPVLSNGEKFRADLARIISEAPAKVVVDEFTSVVDRQIAQIGALAFQKAWRRTGGQAVLLSCHYDILDWLEPDWVFDTRSGEFQRGSLWRRPRLELEVHETSSCYWALFEPHHYLKLPKMVAARYFVGFINGEPVVHLGVAPRLEVNATRACRMVVMPEWQGAGVGLRFLNLICDREVSGHGRFGDRVKTVYFHTSHPGLCSALRRDKRWAQVSASLYGGNKAKSSRSIRASALTAGAEKVVGLGSGYGGHFRAVQGFKYLGARAVQP